MKDYNYEDYESFKALKEDFLADLNADFQDLEIASPKYTDCEILEIERFTDFGGGEDAVASVSTGSGILSFCLKASSDSGLLILPEDKRELLGEYFARFGRASAARKAELAELDRKIIERSKAERAEYIAQKRAEIEAKAEEAAERKFAAKVRKATEKFEADVASPEAVDQSLADWIEANANSVSAVIPSHLEAAFSKAFGDQPHKVIDSSRTTSGGHPMKFGPSFSISIRKGAEVPPGLAGKVKNGRIQDTRFIAGLVKANGIGFGKR